MTGPDQVRAKLVEIWGLTGNEAKIVSGESLVDAFLIHGALDALFMDFAVERKWMREPKSWLDGMTPVEAMMAGIADVVSDQLERINGRR